MIFPSLDRVKAIAPGYDIVPVYMEILSDVRTPISVLKALKQVSSHTSVSYTHLALTRLFLKDVNIAATTALQALDKLGREKGLAAGANILMPIITIPEHRAKYLLYDNKPCVDDNAEQCKDCLTRRVMSIGDTVGWKQNGDSKHYGKRTGKF